MKGNKMKAIVYTSNSGYTAEYAAILGKKLSLPVCSLAEAKGKIAGGDEIIYLGWIMASSVKGYKKAKKLYNVRAVCGVGMGQTGTQIEDIRKANGIPEDEPVFTLQGGFDMNKLHGIYKFMMKTISNTAGRKLSEKPDKTANESDMLDLIQNGGNRVSEDNLSALIEWYEANI